jgi:hypothetical protein
MRNSQTIKDDKRFLAWVRTQPSWLDGVRAHIQACHVRRASNSGTGYKPLFSAVPMTLDQHLYQHKHGELDTLKFYRPDWGIKTVEQAKDCFTQGAREHLMAWKESEA